MADIKKEQERDELHKKIWGIADDLRGSVDGLGFQVLRARNDVLQIYFRKSHQLHKRR